MWGSGIIGMALFLAMSMLGLAMAFAEAQPVGWGRKLFIGASAASIASIVAEKFVIDATGDIILFLLVFCISNFVIFYASIRRLKDIGLRTEFSVLYFVPLCNIVYWVYLAVKPGKLTIEPPPNTGLAATSTAR